MLGVTATDEDALIGDAVQWLGETALRDAAREVFANSPRTVGERAAAILDWLSQDTDPATGELGRLVQPVFEERRRAVCARLRWSEKPSPATPRVVDRYLEEANRILKVENARRAIRLASVSGALAALAGPVAGGYARRKEAAGLLDYDDLIDRTSDLLFDPGAAWVLYKLDGGLDHLLLDEVQDTAPEQWRIAHALTEEFFAGAGARDGARRTVFAVGDRKQSIYSFQGADTAEFDRSHERTGPSRPNVGPGVQGCRRWTCRSAPRRRCSRWSMRYSLTRWRAGRGRAGRNPDPLRRSRRPRRGASRLWPLAPRPDPPPHRPWTVPEQNQLQTSARQLLADTLADWIRDQTNGSVLLESKGRPLTAGDVLVLVRRRDEFGRALVRALKSRGVPVAGLDRMVLTDQPAVQDLMALADALLLPRRPDLRLPADQPARRPHR